MISVFEQLCEVVEQLCFATDLLTGQKNNACRGRQFAATTEGAAVNPICEPAANQGYIIQLVKMEKKQYCGFLLTFDCMTVMKLAEGLFRKILYLMGMRLRSSIKLVISFPALNLL